MSCFLGAETEMRILNGERWISHWKIVHLRFLARNLNMFNFVVSIYDSGTDDMMSCMGMGLFKSLSKKTPAPFHSKYTSGTPGFPPHFFLEHSGLWFRAPRIWTSESPELIISKKYRINILSQLAVMMFPDRKLCIVSDKSSRGPVVMLSHIKNYTV